MDDLSGAAVQLCNRFYTAFDKADLDGLVAVFTDDAVVEIGAGDSASAVDYSGVIRGRAAIRDYYGRRFGRGQVASAPIRPFCGLKKQPCVFFPWVVMSGEIRDELGDGTVLYKGEYLHVWTVDAHAEHVRCLSMHLRPSARVPAGT